MINDILYKIQNLIRTSLDLANQHVYFEMNILGRGI
jgi:hypothetical protein